METGRYTELQRAALARPVSRLLSHGAPHHSCWAWRADFMVSVIVAESPAAPFGYEWQASVTPYKTGRRSPIAVEAWKPNRRDFCRGLALGLLGGIDGFRVGAMDSDHDSWKDGLYSITLSRPLSAEDAREVMKADTHQARGRTA